MVKASAIVLNFQVEPNCFRQLQVVAESYVGHMNAL